MFSGASIDGSAAYSYHAMAGIMVPKKASYKSLSMCLFASQGVGDDRIFE